MNHKKRRYLKNRRKADARLARGLSADKFLLRKYKYFHKLYKTYQMVDGVIMPKGLW